MILNRRGALIALGALAAGAAAFLFRVQLAVLARLVSGGMATACLLYSPSRLLERRARLSRPWALAGALATVGGVLVLLLTLLLPPLVDQLKELIAALPALTAQLRYQASLLSEWMSRHGLGRLSLPEVDGQRLLSTLPPILGGTASFAGSVVSGFTELTLMVMLGYYFLRDRERLALHAEMLVPAALRPGALKMAAAMRREIGTYLRGQLLIALIVGGLSALGLMLAGVRAFLALGLIMAVFNMIPYFGPLLGAIPAVLMALTQGVDTAALAALALFIVQQLDGMVVAPRVMGSLTGLHPAAVLVAITLGGSLSGVLGMLLAIPFLLAARAASRLWLSRAGVGLTK